MAQYIFNGVGGESPRRDALKRRIAEQLMGRGVRPVSSVGEGIGQAFMHLGDAFHSKQLLGEADESERVGRQSAADATGAALGNSSPLAASIAGRITDPSAAPIETAPLPPAFGSGSAGSPSSASPDLRSGIQATAQALGIDPVDLATAISYETAGTFNPTIAGPRTQWGQHKGLIQFGEAQAGRYGVDWDDPVNSQLGENGAIARYLKDAGVQPGMGLPDIYSAINAGGVGRMQATDANNGGAPGTVADKVAGMGDHRQKAIALLGTGDQQQMPVGATPTQGQAPQPMQAAGPPAQTQAPPQAGNERIARIIQTLNHPYLDDGQRTALTAILQQQMQAQDPMRQAQLEQLRLENERLRNPQRRLMNAGEGRLYDQDSGEWIAAPNAGTKAPTVQEFYDEKTGQPYAAQWNREGGTWDRVGGTKAPGTRPLPQNTVNALSEAGAGYADMNRIAGGFDDEYGGQPWLGDLTNWYGRTHAEPGSSSANQAQWWQDYQTKKNITRNQLFGSALTATEKGEFEKADVNPSMSPSAIRANLQRQSEAATRAARKLADYYTKAGYPEEQIEAAIGVPLADLRGGQDGQPGSAPQGARQAPDGNFYVPDPARPGKYLQVQP